MIFLQKKVCFFIFFFPLYFFSFLSSSQESISPIFDKFKDRTFELTGFGADSFLLKISGVEEFENELLECEIPTVALFYSVKSNKNNDFKNKMFQVAAELQSKVKFLSIEINDNVDLMMKLKADFFNLLENKEQVLSQKEFLEFFQYFSSSYVEQLNLIPFFLFFKNDFLVIPQNYKFETKELLMYDINKFLLAPNPTVSKNLKEKSKKQINDSQSDTQNWWAKVKISALQLKDGFLNFINRLKRK